MPENKYDVIIIGAGMGGLTCANYLAQAGKKVLVLEKNGFAGGYCSSFTINGFFFNSCAHHLINDAGPGQPFAEILRELKIYDKKDYFQLNPLTILYLGNNKYILKSNYRDCIRYLKSLFPKEGVDSFFSLMDRNFMYLFRKFKNETFKAIVDKYFNDYQIKGILYSLVFILGEFPDRISGLYALKFINSIFKYGGFYPRDGMQNISDKLVDNLYKNHGEIILNNAVKKILVKNKVVYGIMDSGNKKFSADVVVSNISPMNTFKKLNTSLKLSGIFKKRIQDADLAQSAFIVHVALKNKMKEFHRRSIHIIAPNYKKDSYEKYKKLYLSKSPSYEPIGFICMSNTANQRYSLDLKTSMYYKPKIFWDRYKDNFADKMINKIENISPGFKNNILFKRISTPYTFESYSGNNKGTIGGWAMTPQQTGVFRFPYYGPLKNLYFVGHWTYPGIGVRNAAISGKTVAELILNV